MTDNLAKAIEAMGFEPEHSLNLTTIPMTPPRAESSKPYQRHLAIEWEGGVLWLNFFDFSNSDENPHYCIDVRQFNSAGKVKGEGVFTMARGYRGVVGIEGGDDSNIVKGRDWAGGYVVCILTDPDGQETHTDDERE